MNLPKTPARQHSHLATLYMYQYLQECSDNPSSVKPASAIHQQNIGVLSSVFESIYPTKEQQHEACRKASTYINKELSEYLSLNSKELMLTVLGHTMESILTQVKHGKPTDLNISVAHLCVSILGWSPTECTRIAEGKEQNCQTCASQKGKANV